MSEFHQTEIDGVPVIWAPADGELRAGLVFRVGRADETLARSGITHLLEHLVLHRVERPDMHFNGATSPLTTTFAAHGRPDEVREFLNTVCQGLREPPIERLATEVEVLRTEAAGRSRGFVEPLRAWRYGPTGYGLPGYPEFGLNDLTPDDVHAWAASWFVAGNAALWVSGGPPPDGLRLDLPAGSRFAPPPARTVLPRIPAYFTANVDGVAFETILARRTAADVYAVVLDRRLHRGLRREQGISYNTMVAVDTRDAEYDTLTAFADTLPAKHSDLTREFVNVLIDLAAGRVAEEELATVRAIAHRTIFEPAAITARLAGNAKSILLDKPVHATQEIWDNVLAVTAAEVVEVAGQALDSALLMVPHGQAIGRAGFVAAPTRSAAPVDGAEHRPRNEPDVKRRLVTGPDGVSLVDGLDIATVRFDQCVAMLAWPDGARVLFAADAISVQLEPQLWEVPASVVSDIDARVPADRVVHLRPRAAESIPQPPSQPQSAPHAPSAGRAGPVAMRTSHRRYGPLMTHLAALALLVLLVELAPSASPIGVFIFLAVVVGNLWVRKAAVRRRPTGGQLTTRSPGDDQP